jgi:hypothetical protein
MLKTIRLILPKIIGVLFGAPTGISNRWTEFKEDMAEHAAAEARKKAREPVSPDVKGCTAAGSFFSHHLWDHRYGWNGGIHDQGAIGRSGWRCYHCPAVVWDTDDEEYVKTQSDSLLIQATSMPEAFLEFFSDELLQRRVDYHHDRKVHDLMNEQEHLRERLAELDEVEQNGGMLLTGTR